MVHDTSMPVFIYETDDGELKVEVQIQDETVWLTQEQIAELFNKGRSTIAEHIQNIFKEGELDVSVVCRDFRQTTQHGAIKGKTQEKMIKHYNLDVIISVGYRVKSLRGTQFRIWATKLLKEYIIKGFTIDDERMKQGRKPNRYFEELLQRIRDIRSSERNFYQKITDIYATSIDYATNSQTTRQFFACVQNKMHYAVHGHTAAEIIHKRADSKKPMMGLTNHKGNYVTAGDIETAKNYLSQEELQQLNLVVSLYLDFAELQATNKRPMTMADWIQKLDDFLRLSEKELLNHIGKISADQASKKAKSEFKKYKAIQDKNYISDFDHILKKLEQDNKAI